MYAYIYIPKHIYTCISHAPRQQETATARCWAAAGSVRALVPTSPACTHTHTHTHTFPGDHVRMRHTNESATYECTHTQTHTHAHMPSIHLTPASHIPNPHHISPIHTTRQTPLTPPSRNIAEICQNLHCSAYVWVTAHTNELCDFKKKESSAKNLSKSADISIRTILWTFVSRHFFVHIQCTTLLFQKKKNDIFPQQNGTPLRLVSLCTSSA